MKELIKILLLLFIFIATIIIIRNLMRQLWDNSIVLLAMAICALIIFVLLNYKDKITKKSNK